MSDYPHIPEPDPLVVAAQKAVKAMRDAQPEMPLPRCRWVLEAAAAELEQALTETRLWRGEEYPR